MKLKIFSMLIAAGLVLVSCEGPMGPAGLDGANGKDGKDGLDGKDANASCNICHNNTTMASMEAQFEMSDKGERGARSGKYCAKCHTTEGFQETVKMGSFFPSNEMLNGTKHGCTTCHKHSSFEFIGDTVTQILRTITPIYSVYNNMDTVSNSFKATVTSDYGSKNNLCANCHQYRGSRSGMVYSDTLLKKSNVKFSDYPYWPLTNGHETDAVKFKVGANIDIHEGANQADYLIGKSGYEYTGVTYTRTWAHSTNACTDCHFNKYDATTNTGGHTMVVNQSDPKCTTCHNISDKRAITLAAVNAKLVELGDILVARKVFKKSGSNYSVEPSHDFYGTLLPTTLTTDKYAVNASRKTSVSPTNGLLQYYVDVTWAVDNDYANRPGRTWTYGELGAAWNYTYVSTTASSANRAVHNPTYAMQLLTSSINWLNANPVN